MRINVESLSRKRNTKNKNKEQNEKIQALEDQVKTILEANNLLMNCTKNAEIEIAEYQERERKQKYKKKQYQEEMKTTTLMVAERKATCKQGILKMNNMETTIEG